MFYTRSVLGLEQAFPSLYLPPRRLHPSLSALGYLEEASEVALNPQGSREPCRPCAHLVLHTYTILSDPSLGGAQPSRHPPRQDCLWISSTRRDAWHTVGTRLGLEE